MKILFIFSLILFFMQVSPTLAYEEVVTLNSGDKPYLVVVSDKLGSSKNGRKPGIYIREQKGNSLWRAKPIIPGNPLVEPATGGIIKQLEISKNSKRFEALVIINGKLNLFSINTRSEDKQSYISFGGSENPVYDPILNRKISVPKVKAFKEVSVFQAPTTKLDNGTTIQLVLVSQKIKNSPFGSGVTYGFLIKQVTSKNLMELVNVPLVLDYNFRENVELRELYSYKGNDAFVVSTNFIDHICSKDCYNNKTLLDWRNDIINAVNFGSYSDPRLPRLSLVTGKFKLLDRPYDHVISNMMQVYNPLEGDYIRVEKEGLDFKIPGSVDSVTNEKGELEFLVREDPNLDYAIVYINQVPYVYEMKTGQLLELSLKYDEVPVDFSFISVSHRNMIDFLVSYKLADGEKVTEHVKLVSAFNKIKNEQFLQYIESFQIIEEFYSQEELEWRIHVKEKMTFFDFVTPKQGEQGAYEQMYNPYSLHVDLQNSKDGHQEIMFFSHINEKNLDSNIWYKVYDDEKTSIKKTGLYIKLKNSNIEHIQGELLYKDNGDAVWAKATQEIEGVGNVDIQLFLIDKTRQEGKGGFTEVIVVRKGGEGEYILYKKQDQKPLSMHNYYSFLSSLNKKKGNFVLVDSYRIGENDSETLASSFIVNKDGKNIFFSEHKSFFLEDAFEEDSLISRVRFDKQGDLYFDVTPDLDFHDPSFKLTRMLDGETVLANTLIVKENSFETLLEKNEKAKAEINRFHKAGPAYRWKVHKHNLNTNIGIQGAKERMISGGAKLDFFPELFSVLEKASDIKKDPSHNVVIVPDKFIDYVSDVLLYKWTDAESKNTKWSYYNKHMQLFNFDRTGFEPYVQDYMQVLNSIGHEVKAYERAVLLASASDLITLRRPKNSARAVEEFKLETQDFHDVDETSALRGGVVQANKIDPHILYLIANEGKPVSLDKYMHGEKKKNYSIVILAKESEWIDLMKEIQGTEDLYGLEKHFNEFKITAPDRKVQKKLFMRVLNSPGVASVRYKYDSTGIRETANEIEAQEAVVDFLISRVETLNSNEKRNGLLTLSEVLLKLENALLKDKLVRDLGVIDRAFVQKILAQVFNIPLKLELLPPNDPLVKLSQEDILIQIQDKGGYEGDYTITREIVDTILSQTRPSSSLNIPASAIIYGKTGTGKTAIFKALVKVLDLKLYDFSLPVGDRSNQDAQAFFLNCADISSDHKKSYESGMHIDEALKRFDEFLTLPNGSRGFILFDDIHFTDDKVKKQLFNKLRVLHDNKSINIKSPSTEGIEKISTRNLFIMTTFNPTDIKKKISETAGQTWKMATPEEIIIASTGVDLAYLRRQGLIKNVNQFPVEAKGPSLIGAMQQQADDLFSQEQYLVVARDIIGDIVDTFKELDARTFLDKAPYALVDRLQNNLSKNNPLSIIVRKPERSNNKNMKGSSEKDLIEYVRKNSVVYSIETDIEGKLLFINHLADNFRTLALEKLLHSFRKNPYLAGGVEAQKNFLSFSEQAMLDHINEFSSVRLSSLNIDPKSFEINDSFRRKNFLELVTKMSSKEEIDYEIFADYRSYSDETLKTKSKVNSKYINKVYLLMEKEMARLLQVDSLEDIPDEKTEINSWVRNLSQKDVDYRISIDFGKALSSMFIKYIGAMSDRNLIENRRIDVEQIDFYALNRMFLTIIDRAVSKFQWGEISLLLSKGIAIAVRNQELASMKNVQNYLFGSKGTILRTTTKEQISMILEDSKNRKSLGKTATDGISKRYSSACKNMFVKFVGGI